jgi:hypothetical protein
MSPVRQDSVWATMAQKFASPGSTNRGNQISKQGSSGDSSEATKEIMATKAGMINLKVLKKNMMKTESFLMPAVNDAKGLKL